MHTERLIKWINSIILIVQSAHNYILIGKFYNKHRRIKMHYFPVTRLMYENKMIINTRLKHHILNYITNISKYNIKLADQSKRVAKPDHCSKRGY